MKWLLQNVSIGEIQDLQAEFALEPWGEFRIDLAAADISSMVANAAGGKKGGGQFSPGELMRVWGEEPKPRPRKTWKEVMAYLKGYTRAGGGTINGERVQRPEIPAAKRRREAKAKGAK